VRENGQNFGLKILGYTMIKTNFSSAGVLLGLILGPIAENGIRDLLIVFHGSPVSFVLTRPISIAPLVGIGLALYFSLRTKPWEEEAEQKPGDSAD
jgi:putative tricarboxylic transport membrane protein